MQKTPIIGLSKDELKEAVLSLGEKPFRAKQLWQWLYFKGVCSFDEMTDLSKDLRQKLSDNFVLERPKIVTEQISKDKTHKWLLEFADGERVETVYIPESDRGAVCISTQVGCLMGSRVTLITNGRRPPTKHAFYQTLSLWAWVNLYKTKKMSLKPSIFYLTVTASPFHGGALPCQLAALCPKSIRFWNKRVSDLPFRFMPQTMPFVHL